MAKSVELPVEIWQLIASKIKCRHYLDTIQTIVNLAICVNIDGPMLYAKVLHQRSFVHALHSIENIRRRYYTIEDDDDNENTLLYSIVNIIVPDIKARAGIHEVTLYNTLCKSVENAPKLPIDPYMLYKHNEKSPANIHALISTSAHSEAKAYIKFALMQTHTNTVAAWKGKYKAMKSGQKYAERLAVRLEVKFDRMSQQYKNAEYYSQWDTEEIMFF